MSCFTLIAGHKKETSFFFFLLTWKSYLGFELFNTLVASFVEADEEFYSIPY